MINEEIFDNIARRLPAGIMVPESTIGIHWFLYGLVRLHQPNTAVEIGTCRGDATCFLTRAVIHNGKGLVAGYEIHPQLIQATRDKVIAACGEDAPFEMRGAFPLDGAPGLVPADFVFLDIDPKSAYFKAFDVLSLPPGGLLCAHDLTFPPDAETLRKFADHVEAAGWEVLRLPQERGLIVARRP